MANEKLAEVEKINKKSSELNGYGKHGKREGSAPFRRQFTMAFGTFSLTLGAGAVSGFSAILIPQLQHENKHEHSVEMVSWIAAIASFAMFFGNLLSGYLMERFGRRLSQLMLSVCFTAGWIVIGSAPNVYVILLGRFITGLSQGWLGPLGPVFIGEISSPAYRGFFLAVQSLAIATGVFLSHLYGTFVHWKYASLLCGVFPLVGGTVIFFAPESPAWLASQNRIEDCISSFKWYRGTSPTMKLELDKMLDEQTKKDTTRSKFSMLKSNIRKPEFWKPLLIMTMFFIITQLSGVNVISAYTTDLMKKLIGDDTSAYTAMLSIDILRCVSLCVACVLLKKRGRRPMAMFSGVLTSVSMIALATYMFVVQSDTRKMSPAVGLGLMVVYIVVSHLGVVPLPWNMVGELFATETKGLGSGISVMMTSIAFFTVVKTAPGMFHTIGHHGTYLFYGISTLLGTIYLFFYLPETKGKTLLEVEEYFRYGKKGKTKDVANEVCEPCV